MQLAKVLGNVVATVKHRALGGRKLLMVQPIDPHGAPLGNPMVAVDTVQAGPGDLVLMMGEGGSARQILNYEDAPIRATLVAIVDHVELFADAPA